MKILILAHHAGGLYLPRREFLQRLVEVGHEVTVSVPQGEYFFELSQIVQHVVDAPVDRRGMNPLHDLRLLIYYIRLLSRIRPDCVFTYAIKPNLYGGLASRWMGIPYFISITGLGTAFDSDGFVRRTVVFLYRIVAQRVEGIFFENPNTEKILRDLGVAWQCSILIPGAGVNLDLNQFEEYPQQEQPIKFLFVSRVMKDKGIHELIEAIRIVKKEMCNDIEFHVVGMCEAGYDKQVEAWATEGLIVYHGQQRDVHTYMKNCHCLIHPSYHEGMSNVCLEAAATGRPVLASRIPGCEEIFDEGITGLGFEKQDVLSLVEAIRKFLVLPYEQKRKMGIAGRRKVEREFDRKQVVDRCMQEVERMCSRKLLK